MKRIAVYNTETGEILRTVSCLNGDIEAQLQAGESALETDVNDDTHYVSDGAVVEMPAKPGRWAKFDWATKAWFDPRTLQDLKAAKWEQMKRARDAATHKPLVTAYGTFDADEDSQTLIARRVLMLNNIPAAQLPATLKYTLHDNTVATLTPAQLIKVGVQLGQQVEAGFDRARAVRDQINAATTAAALEAITW